MKTLLKYITCLLACALYLSMGSGSRIMWTNEGGYASEMSQQKSKDCLRQLDNLAFNYGLLDADSQAIIHSKGTNSLFSGRRTTTSLPTFETLNIEKLEGTHNLAKKPQIYRGRLAVLQKPASDYYIYTLHKIRI